MPHSLDDNNTTAIVASTDNLSEVEITDADLLEQLEVIQKLSPSIQKNSIARLRRAQAERNQKAEKRAFMTPVQRRQDITKDEISQQAIEREDIHHIHSVLGLCALPYRKLPEDSRAYDVQYGNMSLSIEVGRLLDPQTGQWIWQGIPYGTKARLLQLHICTRALRQQSPIVELEDNMSAFMRSMGFSVTGGKNGTIARFKEQMNRLAACKMRIGLWNGRDRSKTINLDPIRSFEVWFPNNPDQQILWPSKVELHLDFYNSLKEHALPVDIRSLSAVSHSARQMDLLLWISYRTRNISKKYFLTWGVLKEQFCQSKSHRMDHFQTDFKKDIHSIERIFDKSLPIQLTDEGMFLFPCDTEKLFVPPKKLLKHPYA